MRDMLKKMREGLSGQDVKADGSPGTGGDVSQEAADELEEATGTVKERPAAVPAELEGRSEQGAKPNVLQRIPQGWGDRQISDGKLPPDDREADHDETIGPNGMRQYGIGGPEV